MRNHVRNFIEIVATEFYMCEPIVEIGSFRVSGQEKRANLRSIFPKKQFIGCDIRNGPGVDRIENVENLSFKNESVGTVLILDTLEHVQNCFKALDEIYRVLKKDGIVILSSVMEFPIHDYPSDYWRFTPAAIKLLLGKFPIKFIGYQGKAKFPHTVLGIGIKLDNPIKYNKNFDNIKKKYPDTIWL